MKVDLSQKQIKNFIETCGNGDVYFSHHQTLEGFIEVRYFPCLTHFVDEDGIDDFKKELTAHTQLKRKYLKTITLGENFAYFADRTDDYSNNPLVKNYPAYAEKIRNYKKQELEK